MELSRRTVPTELAYKALQANFKCALPLLSHLLQSSQPSQRGVKEDTLQSLVTGLSFTYLAGFIVSAEVLPIICNWLICVHPCSKGIGFKVTGLTDLTVTFFLISLQINPLCFEHWLLDHGTPWLNAGSPVYHT